MADSDLLITISGAALSLLFYENVRSRGDQMGFLLGENLEFVVKSYTDAEKQIETVKTHNDIETIVTCPLPDVIHDSVGRLNKEKLKDFMRDNSKQVIGWFRFRRDINLVPTFRDKMLHREFASHFSGGNGCSQKFFVMCLLSSSTTCEGGTHKFKHVFFRHRSGAYEPVPLRISNLGNDSFILEGSDYKPTPTKKSSNTPDVFNKLIESLNLNLARSSGLESAIAIQKAAEQYLDKLIPQLCESDLEVTELENQIKEFKLTRKSKMNGSSNNRDKKHEADKDHVRKGQKLKELSPPRIEVPDNVCDERRPLLDDSTATGHRVNSHKLRNTTVHVEKSSNQNVTKTNTDTANSPSKDSLPINAICEMKIDVAETVPNKNKPFFKRESEIMKESISKGETFGIDLGRGRGRIQLESQTRLKKGPSSGPIASRSNSERTSHNKSSQQETTESSYSQITKTKVDNARKSDATNH
ncbi:PREDICTED: BRCA1-A complex subunit Abraxas-like [Dufourea novaeangliae]|uniref:BRCA1-A complex subunit Abraxas-like n=1 Tax=Dufourea novaeangliae TaxID=178035 RepID=UPI00076755A7|nr:PREDICTED: BRCA1-A complex subunit Abraxas-like [Dufourea novaeangliae]XP_015434916.1 PREDICTED: BRCA1-A complex subunit Abraxas-like [Dufourea novaeangliae]